MKIKKVLAAMLVMTMTMSVAMGCGNNASSEGNGDSEGSAATDDTNAAVDEIYECVVEYPTLGETPQDIQLVEDALNEITEEKIGVHVTFYPINAFNSTQETTMMVSSGEKLDLAISIFEGGCLSYVNSDSIIELDELVEKYGQDILAAEGVAMGGGYINGTLYAIPTEEKMGRVKAFEARKDLIDKYNIWYRWKLSLILQDGMARAVGYALHKEFGEGKLIFDCVMVMTTAVISLIFVRRIIGIGLETVLSALFIGRLIGLFGRAFGFRMKMILEESRKKGTVEKM